MPWKNTTIMEQKIEFICEWRTGKHTITELSCPDFSLHFLFYPKYGLRQSANVIGNLKEGH
jgi:hypothetical protein